MLLERKLAVRRRAAGNFVFAALVMLRFFSSRPGDNEEWAPLVEQYGISGESDLPDLLADPSTCRDLYNFLLEKKCPRFKARSVLRTMGVDLSLLENPAAGASAPPSPSPNPRALIPRTDCSAALRGRIVGRGDPAPGQEDQSPDAEIGARPQRRAGQSRRGC